MPRLSASLLSLLGRASVLLALQHLLILLKQIFGHVEHRAAPAAVAVAAPPLVLRLVPRTTILDVILGVVLGDVFRTVLLFVEHAGPTSLLENTVPPSFQILENAMPAALRVAQNRRIFALADGAKNPCQRRFLLHHRRDGVGRCILSGRVTVLRLVADVHLGCFHASRNSYVVRVTNSLQSRTAHRRERRKLASSRYLVWRSQKVNSRPD